MKEIWSKCGKNKQSLEMKAQCLKLSTSLDGIIDRLDLTEMNVNVFG